MKPIPMDAAGRVVLPKEVRSRLNLRDGDLFEALTGPDEITLRLIRTAPARVIDCEGRAVWDAPGADLTAEDVASALARGRQDRDGRTSGL